MLTNLHLFCSPSSPPPLFHRHLLLPPLLPRCTSTTSPPSPLQPHFMVNFLITNCDFPSDRATTVTYKHLSHLTSPDKPNSFLSFMRHAGFDEPQINRIVSYNPLFLCSDVDKTLAPKFKSLHDLHFSSSDIIHLINSHPAVLERDFHRCVLPQILLWESLLGSREHIMKLFKSKHGWFLLSDTEKRAVPNISLLRDCGISSERIGSALRRRPTLIILRSPEEMSAAIEHVEIKLAVDPRSGTFLPALWAFLVVRETGFNEKLNLMRSFGWSEDEFLSAFRRAPTFVTLSKEMLSKKMGFLVKEAGCEPSEVAGCPLLLMFSLQKRLMVRHSVVEFLKSKGLSGRENKMITTMGFSNKVFMEKYVIPHEQTYPELRKMCMAVGETDDSV